MCQTNKFREPENFVCRDLFLKKMKYFRVNSKQSTETYLSVLKDNNDKIELISFDL